MKKLCFWITFIMILTAFSVVWANHTEIPVGIMLDGIPMNLEVAPLYDTEHGRVAIPIRPFSEAVGAEVLWDAQTDTATVVKGELSMSYQLYQLYMLQGHADGTGEKKQIILDVPPVLVNDRTFVPVRALMEGLGYLVDWDDKSKTVMLTTKQAENEETLSQPEKDNVIQAEPEEVQDAFLSRLSSQLPFTENYLLSPMALELHLRMMSNDAFWERKDEMLEILGIESSKDYHVYGKEYMEMLNTSGGSINAMHLFRSENYDFSHEPNDALLTPSKLTTAYLAKNFYNVSPLMKGQNTILSHLDIWMQKNTNYVGTFIRPFTEEAQFGSLLLSPVKFKGIWKTPFSFTDAITSFAQANGVAKETEFMCVTGNFAYYANSRLTAVGLPLNRGFTFYLVLPENGVNPLEFLNHRAEMTTNNLAVTMPQFKRNVDISLRKYVENMGLSYVFTDKDINLAIDPYTPLGSTNDIIQFITLDIHPGGINGEKTSSVDFSSASAEKELLFNKPFTYILCDDKYGEALLLGQYAYVE